MKLVPPDPSLPQSLESLLCRGDIWRGHAHQAPPRVVVDTGFTALNERLVGGGWPVASLLEVCQPRMCHNEWQLFMPAVISSQRGLVVLLNPPASPFAQALLQAGVDLERLLVVEAKSKADFLASFIELARSDACDAVMAWQPPQSLSYTELRKCALATQEGRGIYILFRPDTVRDQSSPAVLRVYLNIEVDQLELQIFKQKGELLVNRSPISLPLPAAWKGLLPHHALDTLGKPKPKVASITPIRGGRR